MGVGAGLYMYVVVVQKFTFAVSSPDEFLYCSRVVWSVKLSVYHSSEPCRNGSTDPHAVWIEDTGGPKEPCIK